MSFLLQEIRDKDDTFKATIAKHTTIHTYNKMTNIENSTEH